MLCRDQDRAKAEIAELYRQISFTDIWSDYIKSSDNGSLFAEAEQGKREIARLQAKVCELKEDENVTRPKMDYFARTSLDKSWLADQLTKELESEKATTAKLKAELIPCKIYA